MPQSKLSTIRTILLILLSLFFAIGAVGNLFASPAARADYLRWGYPDWFHYLTAALEFLAALLLPFGRTRRPGMVLAASVMAAAAATLVVNNEIAHSLLPVVVIMLLAVAGWIDHRVRAA